MRLTSGLDPDEAAAVADLFGVALEQVRRDHMISLVLAALTSLADQLIFFGGTALSRAFLPAGRMSEDIDLIAIGDRRPTADAVTGAIDRALRVSHGRVRWTRALANVRDVEPVVLQTDDGIAVRVQLLRGDEYAAWPTTTVELHQRYSDAPPAVLAVPTRPAFSAWKTVAWVDRAAPRDLWDLWALAVAGGIDREAATLFAVHGPTSGVPQSWMFTHAPMPDRWRQQLAGQTRLAVDADEALAVVRAAWARATDTGPQGGGSEVD